VHFLTIVIGDDPDGQLEPYQANTSGEYPEGSSLEPYVVFVSEEEEYRASYETGVFDGEHEKRWHPERYLRPIREVFPSFEDYMAEVFGEPDARTGRYGRWWNPDAQFDWYQLGGRWTGHLILKPGRTGRLGSPGVLTRPAGPGRADQAKKGDVDFAAIAREDYSNLMAVWDRLASRGKISDPRERRNHDIPESYRTRAQFEAYARRRSVHCAPSALVHRGEWSGPWWLSDEPTEVAADKWDARYSAILAELPDDTLLTVVDCHV
jgi:hypothetical protein